MKSKPAKAEAKPGPDDFIWGAENIGKHINRTAPQVWYGASKGYLDVDHFGRLLRSTPRRLGLVPKEGVS